ncbi:MAG: hypothetical protein U1E27_11145 [Kiritimatiellia bacterium]|nr:hypothetical protein [Kiritimatiellia bacterium]
MKWMVISAGLLLGFGSQSAWAGASVRPEIGIRLVISPDYFDTLDEVYQEYDIIGGFGWFGLHGGVRIQPTERVFISPRIGILVNGVNFDGGEESSYINTLISPAISGRFVFGKTSGFYVEGEASYNIFNIGSDRYDASNTLGLAGLIGYQGRRFDVGAGYSYIPTTVTARRPRLNEERNFGGGEIRFRFSF